MTKRTSKFQENGIFDLATHLADEDLASAIDALRAGTHAPLPAPSLDHLENCPECQAKILEIHQYLQNPLAPPASARVRSIFAAKKSNPPAWLPLAGRVAAAFFVVTFLAAIFFSWVRGDFPHAPEKPSIPAAASPKKSVPGEINANQSPVLPGKNRSAASQKENTADQRMENQGKKIDAFALNHNLEFMVGSRSRSFIVEVYSPANHASFENQIVFSWREFSREPLNLVILNNRNEAVAQAPVHNGYFQFSQPLPPGCYYWKLEDADELYYVGKFFITSSSKSLK